MKTKKELNVLKNEVEALNAKLSEKELEQVVGAGSAADTDFGAQFIVHEPEKQYEHHLYIL